MKRKPRVYIAGKLNAMAVDYLKNVSNMLETAEEVRRETDGYGVFVPAIDLLLGIKFGYSKYEDYFDNGQFWLKASDAVFLVPGWETSEGTKREIETAKQLNIPVFENILEMVAYFKINYDEQIEELPRV
jgi:hypothetical protein